MFYSSLYGINFANFLALVNFAESLKRVPQVVVSAPVELVETIVACTSGSNIEPEQQQSNSKGYVFL